MTVVPACTGQSAFLSPGFQWDAADAYLFDIDGTLINSRDAVHYHAFHHALRSVSGVEASIDGLPVHGNTDPGILRAALLRSGFDAVAINSLLPRIIEEMCADVECNRRQLQPELCPAIVDVLHRLKNQGKLLGAASGNIEAIGWAKLEQAGLKHLFTFGAFSWPLETREEIFRHGVSLARGSLGAQASVCVVGDTPSDITAARAVGIPIIALATGIFSVSQLLPCLPNACFLNAGDLLAMNSLEPS